jgi:hypothetical protein
MINFDGKHAYTNHNQANDKTMTYEFFADKDDKTQILDFIFRETDLQVFDLGSPYGQKIGEYKTTEEILSKFDLHNGDKFAVAFQLWTPRWKGDIVFRKIELDPKYCNGHTFRYSTEGWGLIQLYFGGVKQGELHRSHVGHQSEKRAMALENGALNLGPVSKWDWNEVEKVGRALKRQIHNKMAKRKIASVGVLPGADKLEAQGIKFR